MTMVLRPPVRVTMEEYLKREREAKVKSEFVDGQILAMAGASPEHSAIATDTRRSLGNRLNDAGNGCDVYDSDLKVRVSLSGPFYYPDATVVCETPVFDADDCLLNPVGIVEVLSDSTANFDRGRKFRDYQQILSLRHYILIEQDKVQVEHYERQPNGMWQLTQTLTNLTDSITFGDLQITVPLSEIYRRVFPGHSTPVS